MIRSPPSYKRAHATNHHLFARQANALHHRSDSLSSGVTFLAIGGSWLGFPVLDPLGGLLVAGLIGKQGADLLLSALAELSDRGVEPSVLKDFDAALEGVQKTYPDLLVGWRELRAVKSGVSTFVDVTLEMPPDTKLNQAREVEEVVRKAITGALKGVSTCVHLRLALLADRALPSLPGERGQGPSGHCVRSHMSSARFLRIVQ